MQTNWTTTFTRICAKTNSKTIRAKFMCTIHKTWRKLLKFCTKRCEVLRGNLSVWRRSERRGGAALNTAKLINLPRSIPAGTICKPEYLCAFAITGIRLEWAFFWKLQTYKLNFGSLPSKSFYGVKLKQTLKLIWFNRVIS